MAVDLTTHRWHTAIIQDVEAKLGRQLTDYEKTFITSRSGYIALEMIHDTVKHSSIVELEVYLSSEHQQSPPDE